MLLPMQTHNTSGGFGNYDAECRIMHTEKAEIHANWGKRVTKAIFAHNLQHRIKNTFTEEML